MADPRNRVSFDGIDYQAETYMADSTIVYDATQVGGANAATLGKAVTKTATGQCGLIADGQPILGKLLQVESDGACTVQTDGYCTLPGGNGATFSATAPERAVGALGASSAKGYIRPAVGSAAADGNAAGDTLIVDATVTTAIWVNL